MDFSTGISANFDRTFSYDAVENYNQFLKNNSSFEVDTASDFEKALDSASKKIALNDKNEEKGMGNFMDSFGSVFRDSLNTVNNTRLEADRLQEDLAMGGPTSVHDAMIAAEKASLSMQMAIQVRNRILSAFTEISSMGI